MSNENSGKDIWESHVYSKGRHLNKYPYHTLVGYIYRAFSGVDSFDKVNILELGSGAGNNLWFAAREGFSVAGIDGSSSAIAFAKARFSQDGLVGDFRVGDFASLPWEDNTFDLVIDRGSLTCNPRSQIEAALDESCRVLKPGGRFFSMIYSYEHPGRLFGRCIGANAYDDFTDGYFQGLGVAYFVSKEEIGEMFNSRFSIELARHTVEEDFVDGVFRPHNAFWIIEGRKRNGSA